MALLHRNCINGCVHKRRRLNFKLLGFDSGQSYYCWQRVLQSKEEFFTNPWIYRQFQFNSSIWYPKKNIGAKIALLFKLGARGLKSSTVAAALEKGEVCNKQKVLASVWMESFYGFFYCFQLILNSFVQQTTVLTNWSNDILITCVWLWIQQQQRSDRAKLDLILLQLNYAYFVTSISHLLQRFHNLMWFKLTIGPSMTSYHWTKAKRIFKDSDLRFISILSPFYLVETQIHFSYL